MVAGVNSTSCVQALRDHVVEHPGRSFGIAVTTAALSIIGIVGSTMIGLSGGAPGLGLLIPSATALAVDLGAMVWMVRVYRDAKKNAGQINEPDYVVVPEPMSATVQGPFDQFISKLTEIHECMIAVARLFEHRGLQSCEMKEDGRFTFKYLTKKSGKLRLVSSGKNKAYGMAMGKVVSGRIDVASTSIVDLQGLSGSLKSWTPMFGIELLKFTPGQVGKLDLVTSIKTFSFTAEVAKTLKPDWS